MDQLEGLLEVGPVARRLADRFWPGPLTLALPLAEGAGRDLPESLTGGRGSVAVRLPDHHVPRALARRLGPLAVTSANRSGEPEARTADELLAHVGASVALVIDDGPVRGGVASSVVALDSRGGIVLLREGAISRSELEAALAGR
jgi:tRNA threonylcarbamoyl adenosine modification protein (Sua5/YciO/YrdC/YwlC family)